MAVRNIISMANCSGPSGNYTTEVHCTDDGYVLFHQSYTYRDDDFRMLVVDSNTAFSLHADGSFGDTLPVEMIELAKGHAYCMIAVDPDWYFYDLQGGDLELYRGDSCLFYTGLDRFGKGVRVFVDPEVQQLSGFLIHNPFNPEEIIETLFLTWQEIDGIEWPDSVRIIQAGLDTFDFHFVEIEVNSDTFQTIQFKK